MTDQTPKQPDHEEYEVLVDDLSIAKRELYVLERIERHNDTPVVGYEPLTVGQILYGPEASKRGDKGAPFGEVLYRKLAAANCRLVAAQEALDDWNARDEAWRESLPRLQEAADDEAIDALPEAGKVAA